MLNTPKDNFSTQAKLYAQYRPQYPTELYDFIFKHVQNFDAAWDCATGNGQVAVELAKKFTKVFATDISQKQLDNAVQLPNIEYSLQRAEETTFADNSLDLITVGQALHWFNFDAFNAEARRVLKPGGVVAVWMYDIVKVNPEVDKLFNEFYKGTTDAYWDPERDWVDKHYVGIPFAFEEVETQPFEIKVKWTLELFEGYLNTWSAVQKYIKVNGSNPVDGLIEQLKPLWSGEAEVVFPVYLRLGINRK